MTRSGHARRPAAVAVVAGMLLAGCGGEAAPSPDPSASAPGTESPAPSEPASATSPSSTPAVQPATGVLLAQKSFSVRLPEKWRKEPSGAFTRYGGAENGLVGVALVEAPDSLSSLDAAFRREAGNARGVRRNPDVELGGVPAFAFTHHDDSLWQYSYGGALPNGHLFVLRFHFARMLTKQAEAERLVDSVLASFELR